MGKDKDGKVGSVTLFNHVDISRSDAEKIQCWCRLGVGCSGGEISNAPGLCSFHGKY
jgi:hypothetical protein